tara:strand:- start:187 stop:939 length:753 start_codon:yes stop_codon:yes gene_type:complete
VINITISIVSHGQISLVYNLLEDLNNQDHDNIPHEIIITINTPEDFSLISKFENLNIVIIENEICKGFGENHNFAFLQSKSDYFCIVNPDIRILSLGFNNLISQLSSECKIIAPLVLSPNGTIEDSFRKYPSILNLFTRHIGKKKEPDYELNDMPICVDWIAGMFMLVKSNHFRNIRGFDEKFFMYLEDVDICKRTYSDGGVVIVDPREKVIHDARRASFKSFQHLKWHILSLIRFLLIKPIMKFFRGYS